FPEELGLVVRERNGDTVLWEHRGEVSPLATWIGSQPIVDFAVGTEDLRSLYDRYHGPDARDGDDRPRPPSAPCSAGRWGNRVGSSASPWLHSSAWAGSHRSSPLASSASSSGSPAPRLRGSRRSREGWAARRWTSHRSRSR